MPPKKKYTKEQIVEQAFEIAKVEGIEEITIRKVAEKLNSSTAPIYVNFKNAEALINEVIKKTFKLGQKLVKEADSGDKFKDIGLASLHFAQQYPVLFRDLIMNQNKYMADYDQELGKHLIEEMKEDSNLKNFSETELETIFLKMRIIHTGLAVMVANGLLGDRFSAKEEEELLDSLAQDIVQAAKLNQ
jgi:AcrR family transcriptional regulator